MPNPERLALRTVGRMLRSLKEERDTVDRELAALEAFADEANSAARTALAHQHTELSAAIRALNYYLDWRE